MTSYTFDVFIDEFPFGNIIAEEAIATAPFDAYPSAVGGANLITVYIDAEGETEAVRTVDDFLHDKCPYITVKRFVHELVTLPEIAARLGVSHEAVRMWSRGQRSRNFPTLFQTAGTVQLWSWQQVYMWALKNSRHSSALLKTYTHYPLSHGGAVVANARLQKRAETKTSQITRKMAEMMTIDGTLGLGQPVAYVSTRNYHEATVAALSVAPMHIISDRVEEILSSARLDT